MMDSELAALYRDVIIDHNKSPRNYGELNPPCQQADGYNPLCGDQLTVYLHTEGDHIKEASFRGNGCAISIASASLMTEALKGKTVAEARELFERMHALLTEDDSHPDEDKLGKLAALEGVRAYPSRVKCATLAWHTLQSALAGAQDSVTTE